MVGATRTTRESVKTAASHVQGKVEDFVDAELGRASPYGVYAIGADEARVSVGAEHDASAFAVQTIRRWWFSMGRQRHPQAKQLLITADGAGSIGHRVRLLEVGIAPLGARDGLGYPGLALSARHQQVERGRSPSAHVHHHELARSPLISREVVGEPDREHEDAQRPEEPRRTRQRHYAKRLVVADEDFAARRIGRDEFYGDRSERIRLDDATYTSLTRRSPLQGRNDGFAMHYRRPPIEAQQDLHCPAIQAENQCDAAARSRLDALIDQALCIDFTQALQRKGRPGAIAQRSLQAEAIVRFYAQAGIDREAPLRDPKSPSSRHPCVEYSAAGENAQQTVAHLGLNLGDGFGTEPRAS